MSKNGKEFVVAIGVSVVAIGIAAYLDLNEAWIQFSAPYERFELDELRAVLEEQELSGLGQHVKVTVSGGVSCFPRDGDDIATLIRKADTALYVSKTSGRNQIHIADEHGEEMLEPA